MEYISTCVNVARIPFLARKCVSFTRRYIYLFISRATSIQTSQNSIRPTEIAIFREAHSMRNTKKNTTHRMLCGYAPMQLIKINEPQPELFEIIASKRLWTIHFGLNKSCTQYAIIIVGFSFCFCFYT